VLGGVVRGREGVARGEAVVARGLRRIMLCASQFAQPLGARWRHAKHAQS